MEYRAISSRTREGHGTNFFTRIREKAEEWAKAEAKEGFYAQVFQVREMEVSKFEPSEPSAPPVKEDKKL